MLADMKYKRRQQQQQVEAHGSFANTCQSGCFLKFNLSQRLFHPRACSSVCVCRMEASIKGKINRLQICDTPEVVWQRRKMNLRWNDVVVCQTRIWIHPCQRSQPDQRRKENHSQEEVRIHANVRWTILQTEVAYILSRISTRFLEITKK